MHRMHICMRVALLNTYIHTCALLSHTRPPAPATAGTGVLSKRADLRWRRTPEQLDELVELQVGGGLQGCLEKRYRGGRGGGWGGVSSMPNKAEDPNWVGGACGCVCA